MKRSPKLLLLVLCSLICHVVLSQDEMNKEYVIKFAGYNTRLSKQAGATVDSIAAIMKVHPDWNMTIGCRSICHGSTRKNKVIWDRVNLITTSLVTNCGIEPGRLSFGWDSYPDDWSEIQFRPTNEKIQIVPPPHPNLRKNR